jgi:DNA-binding MarR family transcriptional regulator
MDKIANFGYLLKDLGRLYTRRFEERAQALQLTLPQCKALAYLARNEGISQARLAELAEIDPMSLVRILDHMQAEGWVERRSDPNDRRARCLYIKAPGRTILEEILQLGAVTRAEFLADLSAEETARLIDILERIHATGRSLAPLPTPSSQSAPGKPIKRAADARATRST